MTQPTITIAGAYGAGNIGDEAILAGILATMRAELPDAHLQVLSHDCEATRALHGVDCAPPLPAGVRSLRHLKMVREALSETELLCIGGGGLLYSHGYVRGKENAVRTWWLRTELLRKWEIPYAFLAIGAGPVAGVVNRRILRRMLEGARFVAARDTASAQLLAEIAPRVAIVTVPDPAFALPPPGPMAVEGTVVALRRWFLQDPMQDRAFHEQVLAALHSLVARGEPVRFLPMTTNREGDRALAEELAAELGAGASVLPPPATPQEAVQVLARAKRIVAMRLHAVILAAVAGRPVIPIAYAPKVAAVARQLGLHALDPATMTAEELGGAIEHAAHPNGRAGELGMEFRHRVRGFVEDVLR